MGSRIPQVLVMGAMAIFAGCDGSGVCVSGEWDTLNECVSAKISNNVDDICECETNNWPNGPWFMRPDEDVDNNKECLRGTFTTLRECEIALENNDLDDDCECKSDNFPDGPWYTVED